MHKLKPMKTITERVRGKSFLWLCIMVGIGSILLLALAPATYRATFSLIGFLTFAALFVLQAASGVALDHWWVARIERMAQPFSYWWRVAACGVGAAGFAYLFFVPEAA